MAITRLTSPKSNKRWTHKPTVEALTKPNTQSASKMTVMVQNTGAKVREGN
jgi:hypothetical protein